MKKVTLLVPDEIIQAIGTSMAGKHKNVLKTDPESILKLLCGARDYNEDMYFSRPGDVKVLSVEDWDGE